jgi:predicted enzyme related to lactoylglutathione lyase
MHRIFLRTTVLDFAPEVHDQALAFWATALDVEPRPGTRFPEYHFLRHGAFHGVVLVQKLGDGPSRVHLDIETDDVAAEVTRLVGAGATVVEAFEYWTVLRDPAGVLFCVVASESEDLAQIGHQVD